MTKIYRAYVTGCPYCGHWGPVSGCWPCVRGNPVRLLKKLLFRWMR